MGGEGKSKQIDIIVFHQCGESHLHYISFWSSLTLSRLLLKFRCLIVNFNSVLYWITIVIHYDKFQVVSEYYDAFVSMFVRCIYCLMKYLINLTLKPDREKILCDLTVFWILFGVLNKKFNWQICSHRNHQFDTFFDTFVTHIYDAEYTSKINSDK